MLIASTFSVYAGLALSTICTAFHTDEAATFYYLGRILTLIACTLLGML